jgi:hypothetical protein
LAAGDNLLQAEIWLLKAKAHERELLPAPKPQRIALLTAAGLFAMAGADRPAAQAYERAGVVEISLRFTRRARDSFTSALYCYHRANDATGVTRMRERLQTLGVNLDGLPSISAAPLRQIPWFWIRLTVELLVLVVAVYLAFRMR